MDCSGHPHRVNVRYLAAAVAGTLLVYAARWVAADEDDQHLRWRCPVPMSAALFTIGQLGGVAAVAFKDGPCSLRGRDEPPAAVPLRLYMCVSVTSSVMLGFVLLWAGGIFPQPRCLSGSAACLQLRDNLEQTGWITAALCGLAACQLMGAVAAGRSLCCPGFIDDTGGGGPTLVREMSRWCGRFSRSAPSVCPRWVLCWMVSRWCGAVVALAAIMQQVASSASSREWSSECCL
jgi:hypothetical protein